jgi:hypothetical protein
MAGSAVFPLLKYEPSVLAVTAVVCGAHLVVKQSHKDVKMDEGLNNGLAELCGVDVARTLECRKEVVQFINLDNLVLTNVEAQAIMAGESPCRGRSGSRLASWVHTTVGTAANSPPPPLVRARPRPCVQSERRSARSGCGGERARENSIFALPPRPRTCRSSSSRQQEQEQEQQEEARLASRRQHSSSRQKVPDLFGHENIHLYTDINGATRGAILNEQPHAHGWRGRTVRTLGHWAHICNI